MNNLSIEKLKKMRAHAASLCHDSTVSALDELIAIRELKGDLVPLQQLFKEAIAWGRVYGPTMAKDLWFEMLETQSGNFAGRFTAPQKPVVLPKFGPNDDPQNLGRNIGIKECKAAIEAADGIVKDGE